MFVSVSDHLFSPYAEELNSLISGIILNYYLEKHQLLHLKIITKLFTKRLSHRGGRAPVYHFDTIFNQLNTRFHHKKKIFYIFDHFWMKNVTGPFSSRVASQVLTNLLIPVFAILNDPLLKTVWRHSSRKHIMSKFENIFGLMKDQIKIIKFVK